jgi:hypothetical protein
MYTPFGRDARRPEPQRDAQTATGDTGAGVEAEGLEARVVAYNVTMTRRIVLGVTHYAETADDVIADEDIELGRLAELSDHLSPLAAAQALYGGPA